jgi:hypothetical protein
LNCKKESLLQAEVIEEMVDVKFLMLVGMIANEAFRYLLMVDSAERGSRMATLNFGSWPGPYEACR